MEGEGDLSSGSMSITGRIASLLGSDENAIRILFSLLLGRWSLCCLLDCLIDIYIRTICAQGATAEQ